MLFSLDETSRLVLAVKLAVDLLACGPACGSCRAMRCAAVMRGLTLISNACQTPVRSGRNKTNMAAITPKPPIVRNASAAIASASSATGTTDSIGSTKDKMDILFF
jgi:hypothetical protein